MERRQDRPAVQVLHGDRLHVGGGVHGAQRDAVPGQGGDEHRLVTGQREHGHGGRDPEQARPQDHRAVDALAGRLGKHGAQARQQHHHQQEQGERGVAVTPMVLHVGQPGGQADEHEALGEEAGRAGPAGA